MSARPSVLNGSMIVASTAIGAGMLANPTATSGVWFLGALLVLGYTWLCMSLSGLMLLEANLHFKEGASFHTMVRQLLGPAWNVICGLSVAFVLYSLTYAYIFVGGGLTQELLNNSFNALNLHAPLSRTVAAVLFLSVLSACVISSTRWVGRLATLLIGGMVFSFAIAVSGLIGSIQLPVLFNHGPEGQLVYWQYIWLALPVCLASFGFHGNVPGLVDYHQGQAAPVARSIWLGSSLALLFYVFWQLVVQGNLPRSEFAPVIAADGDVSVLLAALSTRLNTQEMAQWLGAFAYMAVTSSFLGVTLGLFDYMRDLFGFANNLGGRIRTALVTFLPPLLAYLWMPTGFVKVMGYVGLMAAIWAVLIPALLAYVSRRRFPAADSYRVRGGHFTIGVVILFAVLVFAAQVLILMGWLPVFKG